MTRTTLYRHYRPERFDDVVGQEQITEALREQLQSGTLSHAYLFAGSRGLGKTSIARILAHELHVSGSDLYEIDAASNNSVEDIRQLTENVYTLPFESPKKIYILDEAHMLSKAAWNAFLKTLEEPPAHALFILATTELDKVPETVQSRCQVFEFRKPKREDVEHLLTHVAKKEKITLEAGVVGVLALLARGSYRDALSHFEKVLSASSDSTITLAEVEKVSGAPRHALIRDCVSAVASGDLDKALLAVRKVEKQGTDVELFLALLTEYVRNALLLLSSPSLSSAIEEEIGSDQLKELRELVVVQNTKLTHIFLKRLLEAAAVIRYQSAPAIVIELALIEHLSD